VFHGCLLLYDWNSSNYCSLNFILFFCIYPTQHWELQIDCNLSLLYFPSFVRPHKSHSHFLPCCKDFCTATPEDDQFLHDTRSIQRQLIHLLSTEYNYFSLCRHSYMFQQLTTITGPSIHHFKARWSKIQVYSLCWIPQVYNNCYNIIVNKTAKTGCKLGGGCKIISLP